jgi:hypothetical protein
MGCSVEEVCSRAHAREDAEEAGRQEYRNPQGKTIEETRKIGDEIERRLAGL